MHKIISRRRERLGIISRRRERLGIISGRRERLGIISGRRERLGTRLPVSGSMFGLPGSIVHPHVVASVVRYFHLKECEGVSGV